MKILLFINSLGAGGAERSMIELGKFLQSQNFIKVKFVCLERKTIGLEQEAKNYGLETIFLDQRNASWVTKINFYVKIIKKENPDILHSVLAESNLVLRFSKFFIKKGKIVQSLVSTPYSLERRNDHHLAWRKFLLFKQIDKWTARLFPNIFYHPISHEVFKHYKSLYWIKENYRIIYRGRHDSHFINKKNDQEVFKLINIGRQEFAKGQIVILQALKYLREEYGMKHFHLEILGRPGQSTAEISDFIQEHKLQGQVKLTGFVKDPEKRLSESDAFVFSSYYEGLGGGLLEAFAAGLPCICSDISVLKEVVGSEDGALFFPPGDYLALAQNILNLTKDNELQKKLSEYSYYRFKEKFRIEIIHQEMLEMYKDVLHIKNH